MMLADTKRKVVKAHNKAVTELALVFEAQGLNSYLAFNHAARIVNDAELEVEAVMRPFVPEDDGR